MLAGNQPSSTETLKAVAELNGTRLYYEVSGAGHPLVLIHGFTLDTRMWADQVRAFAPAYRVVRYDLRGFGKSALPGGEPYTHHDDLYALLEHLGISQAHILGQSLGGAIAVDFALAYPDATSSLILVDVSGLDGFMWPDELSRWFASINGAARSGDLSLAKQRWLDTGWFTPARANPEVVGRLEQIVTDYSGWHFVHDNPTRNLTPPANERLAEIRVPTLVILGELDLPFYNHPLADRLEQGISNAQKVIMAGVGHMSNMEDPDRFNQIVLSFLAAQGSAV
jgi:3-oxoadipate enol-lactonase